MKNFFINHKKIIIISIIAFLIIVALLIGLLFFYFYKKNNSYSYVEQISYNNDFSIQIPDVFEFEKQEAIQDYDLVLISEKYNSRIYISSFDSSRVRSITDVIQSDKEDFILKFQGTKEVTDLKGVDITGLTVYEYNFTASGRFIQNYYIVKENNVYVFDFDIDIKENYEYNLKDFTNEIVESFKLN